MAPHVDWKMIKYFALSFVAFSLLLVIFWKFYINQSIPDESAVTSQIDVLYAGCIQDMVNNTCKVMSDSSGRINMETNASNVIFVAGVGAIDAKTYQEIYSYGADMCNVVRTDCTENWDGRQCKIARVLYRH